jgi:restriction system protein
MARHTAAKIFTGVMSLPWWISAAFALLSYVLCMEAPELLQFENPFFAGLDAAVHALPAGAPVAAGVFALIAVLNIIYAVKFRRVIGDRRSLASVEALTSRELELLVAEGFRHQSYAVEHTASGLRLRKGGCAFVVHLKHWRHKLIDVAALREVHNAFTTEMADGAMVLAVGEFTPEAELYASANHMTLYNGAALVNLVKDVHVEVPLLLEV